MKQFKLTLARFDQDKIKSFDEIFADDLVELLSQFNMVILMMQKKMASERGVTDDDIPF